MYVEEKWIIIYVITVSLMLVYFFTQYLGFRESNNMMRFGLGLVFALTNTILFYPLLLEENLEKEK